MGLKGCCCACAMEMGSSLVHCTPPPFSLLRATFDSKEELITTRFPLPQADYLQGCSNIRLRTARKMPFGNVPLRVDVQLLIWVMNCLSILTISGLKIALTT